jgi:hypothetical protein
MKIQWQTCFFLSPSYQVKLNVVWSHISPSQIQMFPTCVHAYTSSPEQLSPIIQWYLYNNTPSKAIVNAASNITYRPVIEADVL